MHYVRLIWVSYRLIFHQIANFTIFQEVIEVCTDNKPSGEETLQPRREQPTEREEV